MMPTNRDLLTTFVSAYLAQPATAYWRAIEIGALLRLGIPEGLGLDLGCGDGILTDILLSHVGARQLVGVDTDPLEVQAARKFSFYQRLHVASANAIPESDATFDFVLSNSVLEHIPDLEGVIAEVARLLRPGGTFLFTVPTPEFRVNLYGPLTSTSREDYLDMLDQRLAHVNYLSSDNWREMLTRHGLSLAATFGYLDRGETQRWESLSRMTGGLLYSLSGRNQKPVDIQRSLGLRAAQNAMRLPRPLAAIVAGAMNFGAPVEKNEDKWLAEQEASCLIVTGRRM